MEVVNFWQAHLGENNGRRISAESVRLEGTIVFLL
jgi:hypothetical protein